MSNFYKYNIYDTGNGKGLRTSIFFCGCEHYCKNCFNESIWGFETGKPFTQETIDEILESSNEHIAGLSVLGGEPMHPRNVSAVYCLCKQFKEKYPNKTIWLWSGYSFEELNNNDLKVVKDVLSLIDVLVDGKFIEELKNITLQWRGSSNQRVIDMNKTREKNEIVLLEK